MPPSGNALLDALSGEGARDVAENPFLNAGNAIQAIKMPSSPYRSDTAGPIFAQALLGGGLQQYGISQVEQQRQDRLDALNAIGAPPAFNPTDPAGLQGYLKGQADYVNNARSTLGGNPATASLAAVLGAGGLENAVGLNQAINTGLATNAVKWAPNAGLLGVLGGPRMGSNPLAGDSLQAGDSNVVAGPPRPSLAGAVDPRSEAAALLTSTRKGVGVPTLAVTSGPATGYSNPQSAAALATSEDVQAKGLSAIKSAAQTNKILQDMGLSESTAKRLSPDLLKHISEGAEIITGIDSIIHNDIPKAQKEESDHPILSRVGRSEYVPAAVSDSGLMRSSGKVLGFKLGHTDFGRLTGFDSGAWVDQVDAPPAISTARYKENLLRVRQQIADNLRTTIHTGQVISAVPPEQLGEGMLEPTMAGRASGSSSSAVALPQHPSIPEGMKLQRNPATGETRIVPQ